MSLEEYFKQHQDEPFVFIVQGGNQGDSMIYAGARKLADKTGLNYREISMGRKAKTPAIEPNEIIYVNGGGGWCTWWNWTPRLVTQLKRVFPNTLVVGPSTVALQTWYIQKWIPRPSNRTIFFAREKTTYDYLEYNFYNQNLLLDHDTAMHLKPGDGYLDPLLENLPIIENKPALLLREDPESRDTIPGEILELKKSGYFLVECDPCQTDMWALLHTSASEIWTNRSHSAILGALLGKKTYMFAGSYHKNRSIWEYSLKDRGVKWIDET